MNGLVSRFIEENIDLIERENWQQFFKKLVNVYSLEVDLQEKVLDALDEANIDYTYIIKSRIDLKDVISRLAYMKFTGSIPNKLVRSVDLGNNEILLRAMALLASDIGFEVYRTDMFSTPAYVFLDNHSNIDDFKQALKSAGYDVEGQSFEKV